MDGSVNWDSRASPSFTFLQWDEFCDLLGGARWDEAVARWQANNVSRDRTTSTPELASHFSGVTQFLFQEDPRLFALEVFALKWTLITKLCRHVLLLHSEQQRPLFGLEPCRVLVKCSPRSQWLPVRWLFSVELPDAVGASPFRHESMPAEMVNSLFVPLLAQDLTYVAPSLRDWPLGREIPVTVLIRALDRLQEDADDEVRALLRVHVFSDAMDSTEFSERDVFRITLPPAQAATGVSFWARKVDVAERGIVLSGVTDLLAPLAWTDLERSSRDVFSGARATVYRAFHIPCDLYSLGMLLLRALLVNRRQGVEQVVDVVSRIVGGLDPVVQGIDVQDRGALYGRMSARLRDEGEALSSSAVLFDPEAAAPSIVPDHLWYDALTLALRLISGIPGFSFCRSLGEYDLRQTPSHVERVIGIVDELGARTRVELFGAYERNRAIRRACNRLKTELVGSGNY